MSTVSDVELIKLIWFTDHESIPDWLEISSPSVSDDDESVAHLYFSQPKETRHMSPECGFWHAFVAVTAKNVTWWIHDWTF